MNRHAFIYLSILAFLAVSVAFVSCANWQNMTPAQKTTICQETIKVAAQPECVRLLDKGQKYVDLCDEVCEDAIQGCASIFNRDPSLMCSRIISKADECDLIPDDSSNRELNVASCERVIRAAGLACMIGVVQPEPEPASAPEPE